MVPLRRVSSRAGDDVGPARSFFDILSTLRARVTAPVRPRVAAIPEKWRPGATVAACLGRWGSTPGPPSRRGRVAGAVHLPDGQFAPVGLNSTVRPPSALSWAVTHPSCVLIIGSPESMRQVTRSGLSNAKDVAATIAVGVRSLEVPPRSTHRALSSSLRGRSEDW